MPGILFDCTRCGKLLKARDAKADVQCPFCGAVVVPPQAYEGEEALDQLEEVPASSPARRRPRKRKRAGHEPEWSLADYIWLFAAVVGFVCFLGTWFITWLLHRDEGMSYWLGTRDHSKQITGMFFGWVAGIGCYVGGIYGIWKREFRGKLVITRGPAAVVLGIFLTLFGAVIGGYSLCGVLAYLASGR